MRLGQVIGGMVLVSFALACQAPDDATATQQGSGAASSTDLTARLQDYLSSQDISGSVIVTSGGSTLLSAGYGMANRELAVANTPQTKFRIGSVTKQFTAMGILILQERGRLRVQDTVGTHVPDAPETWRPLTIHQLLTHTSGIMHSWNLAGFAETMAAPATLDSTLERFADQPLLFEPGTGYQYSGVGYFLLAKIIEVISGQAYADFLRAEIFEPLGMHATGADRPEAILEDRASGYQGGQDGTVRNAPPLYTPILTGGGNLYSTVEDLALWGRALADERLLSPESYDAMYQPERESYAYGWMIGELDGLATIAHSGGVPGFNAYILRIPERDLCVVVLTNLVPGRARPTAEALARMVLTEGTP